MSSTRQKIDGHRVTDEEYKMLEAELGKLADLWSVELHHREPIKDDHYYGGKDIRGIRSLKEVLVVANVEDACAIVTDWFDCAYDEDLETDFENLGVRGGEFADADEYNAWRDVERKRKAELIEAIEKIKDGSIGMGQYLTIDMSRLYEPNDEDMEKIVVAHDIGYVDADGDPLPIYYRDVCKTL